MTETLDHILSEFVLPEDVKALMRARLYAREDAMVEVMHLAGVQFGLFPEVVAEVLAEVGIGTPKTGQERELIRSNFTRLMVRLQNEHDQREHGG